MAGLTSFANRLTSFASLKASLPTVVPTTGNSKFVLREATTQEVTDELPFMLVPVDIPKEWLLIPANERKPIIIGENSRGCPIILRWSLKNNCPIINMIGAQITPQLAKWILDRFASQNRPPQLPHVKELADQMAKGVFYYVGNTLMLTVDDEGSFRPIGQCNGGHTCNGLVRVAEQVLSTKLPFVEMDIVFGIPRHLAKLADLNRERDQKDIVASFHYFDKYVNASEVDGERLSFKLTESHVKTLNSDVSAALRILACVLANKKTIKASEKLGPLEIDTLCQRYGHLMVSAAIRNIDLQAMILERLVNAAVPKGFQLKPGKGRVGVSPWHVVAMLVIASTIKTDDDKLTIDKEVADFVSAFLYRFCEFGGVETDPAQVMQRVLIKWTEARDARSKDQSAKWNLFKFCLLADLSQRELTVEDAEKVTAETKVYFETELDQTPKTAPTENTVDESLKELDD